MRRLLLVGAALAGGLACDPLDPMPPPKLDDWSCEEICEYAPTAWGCHPSAAPQCTSAPACTRYCEGNPDITQELLNCLAPTSIGYDMSAPNSGQFDGPITARRPHCEFLLALPDTGRD